MYIGVAFSSDVRLLKHFLHTGTSFGPLVGTMLFCFKHLLQNDKPQLEQPI